MRLRVGDLAADFDLDGIDGTTGEAVSVSLSSLRGMVVVVVFYPADNSPVCTSQLVRYTEGIAALDSLGATVLAISPQDPASHRDFAALHGGFAFRLLSDVDKSVGRAYGIVGLLDFYRRSTFVVDAAGRLTYARRSVGPGLTFTSIEQIAAAVEAANNGSELVADPEEPVTGE